MRILSNVAKQTNKLQVLSSNIKKQDQLNIQTTNTKTTSYQFKNQLGFDEIGYDNLQSGNRFESTRLLKNGEVKILLTSNLTGQANPKQEDEVQEVAFTVDNLEDFTQFQHDSMTPYQLREDTDSHGTLRSLQVNPPIPFLQFRLVDRSDYHHQDLLPNMINDQSYVQKSDAAQKILDKQLGPVYLKNIDHVACAHFDESALDFQSKTFGLVNFWEADAHQVKSENASLEAKVYTNLNNNVKMTFLQSQNTKGKISQINEQLHQHGKEGVQHIAFATDNIIKTVKSVRDRGMELLKASDEYQEILNKRMQQYPEVSQILLNKYSLETLKEQRIIVDVDEKGYLLQLFSNTYSDRPTMFLEFLERYNQNGFGVKNFNSGFDAIEKMQIKRNNLNSLL